MCICVGCVPRRLEVLRASGGWLVSGFVEYHSSVAQVMFRVWEPFLQQRVVTVWISASSLWNVPSLQELINLSSLFLVLFKQNKNPSLSSKQANYIILMPRKWLLHIKPLIIPANYLYSTVLTLFLLRKSGSWKVMFPNPRILTGILLHVCLCSYTDLHTYL